MEEPPKRRDEPILNFYMLHQIFLLGSFTVGLCLLFLNLPAITVHFRETPDHIYLLTAFFALFIFAGVFNCFNARTDRLNLLAGISGNVVFLLIMAIITVIQVIFVYLGGAVLRTAPLTLEELGVTVLLALAVIPAEFLRKLLWRVFHGKNGY
jgi:magnesium-transporting ATPase (P-type)